MVGLVLGEIFNFGRHTVTWGLMALGLTDGDWSVWYRLFSRGRYAEHKVAFPPKARPAPVAPQR